MIINLPVGEDLGDSDSALLGLASSSWPVKFRERGTVGRDSWPSPGMGRKGNWGKVGKGKAECFPSVAAEEFMLWSAVWSLESSDSELLESNRDILKFRERWEAASNHIHWELAALISLLVLTGKWLWLPGITVTLPCYEVTAGTNTCHHIQITTHEYADKWNKYCFFFLN